MEASNPKANGAASGGATRPTSSRAYPHQRITTTSGASTTFTKKPTGETRLKRAIVKGSVNSHTAAIVTCTVTSALRAERNHLVINGLSRPAAGSCGGEANSRPDR